MSDVADFGVEIVREPIGLAHLQQIDRDIMAIGGELHADEEATLLDDGSAQANLWGINLYPAVFGTPEWLEFDSMINVRPRLGNRSRDVEDPARRQRIIKIVNALVRP